MSKWRARRLYRKALESYRDGYIAGAQARAIATSNSSEMQLFRSFHYDPSRIPAHSAGYEYGYSGTSVAMDTLPLDVWARVLAKALEPS